MNATYLIPECNLAELEARCEKLSRRCKRLGVPEITLSKSPDHVRHEVRQLTVDGHVNTCWRKEVSKTPTESLPPGAYLANAFTQTGNIMTWWNVTVTGELPTLNGWSFVAVLEPLQLDDGTAENFVQALPGAECPAEFRTAVGRCDHCHAARRRNQTFVVKHGDGQHKCVGRQCLKDFLGYNADPHKLAGAAELLAEFGSLCSDAGDEDWLGGGGGGYRDSAWDLAGFLALTACRIRLFGWLSRGKAFEDHRRNEATADHIVEMMMPPRGDAESVRLHALKCAKHKIEDADRTKANEAIEWAKGLDATELESSDYLRNVNLVARVGAASIKTAGVAASIIIAFDKAMEREVNRQREAARPESNHVGQAGDRIECIEVTCEKIIRSEGAYGLTGIHKMHDAAGNDLVWFASGSANFLTEGQTYSVGASVKQHSEFRGRKQTVVTRVKVLDETALAKIAKKVARAAKKAAMVAAVVAVAM